MSKTPNGKPLTDAERQATNAKLITITNHQLQRLNDRRLVGRKNKAAHLEKSFSRAPLKAPRRLTECMSRSRSGEVQIQTGHCAAFSNWNRLVTVLCGRRSSTAPAASKCYNRPNDADS